MIVSEHLKIDATTLLAVIFYCIGLVVRQLVFVNKVAYRHSKNSHDENEIKQHITCQCEKLANRYCRCPDLQFCTM